MSRVGKLPIEVPSGTKVELKNGTLHVEGPNGKLTQPAVDGIDIKIDGSTVTFSRNGDSGPERARHGLARALLANAVTGVTEGFKKELEIVGVGYRAEVRGRELHFALGYSHPVVYSIPEGLDVEIDKRNKIKVSGPDKQKVGQAAAQIRGLRRPDPYKGKGIRYSDEVIRLKVGKSGVSSS